MTINEVMLAENTVFLIRRYSFTVVGHYDRSFWNLKQEAQSHCDSFHGRGTEMIDWI